MCDIVIVDHPLHGEGIRVLLEQFGYRVRFHAPPSSVVALDGSLPQDALVLIENDLGTHASGLLLARHLHHTRADLTPIVWTAHPQPLFIWAATHYRLPGLLDKAAPLDQLQGWVDHARRYHAAWPGHLLTIARAWDDDIALRLRSMPAYLWPLWFALTHDAKTASLAHKLGWSPRSVERRLAELYLSVGAAGRCEAVQRIWAWRLLRLGEYGPQWQEVVLDIFDCC